MSRSTMHFVADKGNDKQHFVVHGISTSSSEELVIITAEGVGMRWSILHRDEEIEGSAVFICVWELGRSGPVVV